MDKTDVLEEVGGPNRSFRRSGEDIWIYDLPADVGFDRREVGFKESVVNYVGEVRTPIPVKPAQSNDEANKRIKEEVGTQPAHDFKEVKDDGTF